MPRASSRSLIQASGRTEVTALARSETGEPSRAISPAPSSATARPTTPATPPAIRPSRIELPCCTRQSCWVRARGTTRRLGGGRTSPRDRDVTASGVRDDRGVGAETGVDARMVEAAAAALNGVVTRTALEPSPRLSDRFGVEVFSSARTCRSSGRTRSVAPTPCSTDSTPKPGPGAWCAPAPATTARGSRTRAPPSGSTAGSSSRATPLGRSATGSRPSVATTSRSSWWATPTTTPTRPPWPMPQRTGATVVPAFDDPYTIAGQGTVAIEILEQLGRVPDVLVVPVGGGGLIAGCAAWLRERHPGVRIVGVEPAGAAEVAAGLAAGHPVDLPDLDTFVDGAAVRRAGALTLPVIAAAEVDMITAPEGQVCVEMLDFYGSRRHRAGAGRGAVDRRSRRAGPPRGPGTGVDRGLHPVRRQQRRQPVRRGGRAGAGPRGPQALLPGRVPPGAGRAAPLPGRGAGTGGRHHRCSST